MSSSIEHAEAPPAKQKEERRRGADAIEFALLLPVLLAVTSAIVDYGWYYSQELSMVAAVREGARIGATVDPDEGSYCSAAGNRAREAMTAAGLDGAGARIAASTSGAAPDLVLTVTATVAYSKLIGLLPVPKELSSTTVMHIEHQDDEAGCSF